MTKWKAFAWLLLTGWALAASAGELEAKFGRGLVRADGQSLTTEAGLKGTPLIAVYFSAHWCGPCRQFTPNLVKFYTECNRNGRRLEIVFVSADKSRKDMRNYMKSMHMPWLAVPFDSPVRERLMNDYHVSGIPTLVVLDRHGNIITADGRRDVMKDGRKALDNWLSHARPSRKP